MSKQERVALAIKVVVSNLMEKVLENVLFKDPFEAETHRTTKPLYAALVPDEIFKGSHFERRFVTPFGKVWEKLAQVVAIEAHGECRLGETISGNIGVESLRRIQEVLNRLDHNLKGKVKIKPNWKSEMEYIKNGGGEPIPVTVTCDVFMKNLDTGIIYAFELKGPLPNSDQTKVSKEKMFKLLAMNPPQVNFAYYALPYNPFGKKEDYKWGFPQRWFNMHEDESVLIGDEFWELIGGIGTYSNFIKEINLLGKEYKEIIYTKYLGIQIPDGLDREVLK